MIKRNLVFLIFILLINTLISQTPSVVINNYGDFIVNDSIQGDGLIDANIFAKTIQEDYKIGRLRKPNIRFYTFNFKKSHISLISLGVKRPSAKTCRELIVKFRKKKKQCFKGNFLLLNKRLDWNTTFDEIYSDPVFEKLIDKTIYSNPLKPSKYSMHVEFDRYFFSIWFEKKKEHYRLKKIEMQVRSRRKEIKT